MTIKLFKWLALVQGIYTLVTALWAMIDIESFMKVTGPKTDIWLVKTVAVLLIPISLCFLLAAYIKRDHWLVLLIGITSSAGLAFIDFYYTTNGTINRIYQADGILQVLFLFLWIYLGAQYEKLKRF